MSSTEFNLDQFSQAYPAGIERSWWHVARNAFILRSFKRWLPSSSRVLEIGCGTGIVTNHLRRAGWDIRGVDLGKPTAAILAEEHILLGVDARDIAPESRAAIDTLAMFDVIEHIEDPVGFLKEMLDYFPNATRVIVSVPARMELWSNFDDHFGHFRRYDPGMLRDQFSDAGLRTVDSTYFHHLLYLIIRLNNAMRRGQREIVLRAPAPGISTALNRALGRLLHLEVKLLPATWRGSSLLAVAERKVKA
ncbi:MAG: class I SAM-dependent methyltransferase [Flavobacteriales bacterium]|nr:class I SAM-dependent methyltransferase [Flavobacteriales bacterium]